MQTLIKFSGWLKHTFSHAKNIMFVVKHKYDEMSMKIRLKVDESVTESMVAKLLQINVEWGALFSVNDGDQQHFIQLILRIPTTVRSIEKNNGSCLRDGFYRQMSVASAWCRITGNIGRHEKGLWQAVVESVDPGVAKFHDDRVTYLCTRFREFEPISAEIIHQCFDPDAAVEVPEIAKCQNCMFQFAEFLTC